MHEMMIMYAFCETHEPSSRWNILFIKRDVFQEEIILIVNVITKLCLCHTFYVVWVLILFATSIIGCWLFMSSIYQIYHVNLEILHTFLLWKYIQVKEIEPNFELTFFNDNGRSKLYILSHPNGKALLIHIFQCKFLVFCQASNWITRGIEEKQVLNVSYSVWFHLITRYE